MSNPHWKQSVKEVTTNNLMTIVKSNIQSHPPLSPDPKVTKPEIQPPMNTELHLLEGYEAERTAEQRNISKQRCKHGEKANPTAY